MAQDCGGNEQRIARQEGEKHAGFDEDDHGYAEQNIGSKTVEQGACIHKVVEGGQEIHVWILS